MAETCDLNFQRLTLAMQGLAEHGGKHDIRLTRIEHPTDLPAAE